jgi:hypothetical protein
MRHVTGFISHWDDGTSLQRIKASDKSPDVNKAMIENLLKEAVMRFERGPGAHTTKLWASDIVDAGFNEENVRSIIKLLHFKFEKFPTFAQLIELVRPRYFGEPEKIDELTDLSNRCYAKLKDKFLLIANQEVLDKMVLAYFKSVQINANHMPAKLKEQCVLNDWLRTYFSSQPEKIIEQGKISNQKFIDGDREYFLHQLRNFAKDNNL